MPNENFSSQDTDDQPDRETGQVDHVVMRGPIYGVELIGTLPLNPGRPDGMRQAMPSESDLRGVAHRSERTAAGYEVLLAHFRRACELYRRIESIQSTVETHVGTGEPHYLFAVPCEDFAEMDLILKQIQETITA